MPAGPAGLVNRYSGPEARTPIPFRSAAAGSPAFGVQPALKTSGSTDPSKRSLICGFLDPTAVQGAPVAPPGVSLGGGSWIASAITAPEPGSSPGISLGVLPGPDRYSGAGSYPPRMRSTPIPNRSPRSGSARGFRNLSVEWQLYQPAS
jgi:hypothetical protein